MNLLRGELPEHKNNQIRTKIPEIGEDRFSLATSRTFLSFINDFINETNLNGALESLIDARKRFGLIQITLYEAFACVAWYRESSDKTPDEQNAIVTGKFYLDYAMLLMYATAEDLSYFITYFLGIKDTDIEDISKKKNLFSRAGKIGSYLGKNMPEHEITKIVMQLKNNSDWQKALNYRNAWVHEKPPTIGGLGLELTRDKLLSITDEGETVMYIAGPMQKYTIDELLEIGLNAAVALATMLSRITEVIIEEREKGL